MNTIEKQQQPQHQLNVVKKCKIMINIVYNIIRELPEEKYCANQQIIRSALSVPSNIVEGQQRTDKGFINYLRIAKGSLEELKIQVEIMNDNYYDRIHINYNKFKIIADEVGAMIYGLQRKINADAGAGAEIRK